MTRPYLDERDVRLLHYSLKQEVANGIASGEYTSEADFLVRLVAELTLRIRELEQAQKEKP